MAKKIKTIIVTKPKGHTFLNSNSNFNKRTITLEFKKRGVLGKLLKTKKTKVIKFPKGFSIKLLENNRPNIRKVFLEFEKLN
jgi:hypothetical protein